VKKRQITKFIAAIFLLLCIAISSQTYSATAATTSLFNFSGNYQDWLTGSTYNYQTEPLISKPSSYAFGFMANTVFELRNAYNLNPLYSAGYTGKGQTIVIVNAYGSPTIFEDLLGFIQLQNAYGANLPWATMTEVKNHLHIYYPLGKPVYDSTNLEQIAWSTETTLDVDMAHAIAPQAEIALVIAPNSNNRPLDFAVLYAITQHLGNTISLSWGEPEQFLTGPEASRQVKVENLIYAYAAFRGITVFASAGNEGATSGTTINSAQFPASDPYVSAVGGTNLFMTCNDGFKEGTNAYDGKNHVGIKYSYEIAGNDFQAMTADGMPTPFDFVTTGGAMSSLFALPSWQKEITLTNTEGTTFTPTGRCTSDVSFNSGVYGGLGLIPYSAVSPGSPQLLVIGGTSAGSPFWAALISIANQHAGHAIGFINQKLYTLDDSLYKKGAFHDITIGDNAYPTGSGFLGYKATKGWDAPTGLGSPDAAVLVKLMKDW
jgi:subtilase family serine protease